MRALTNSGNHIATVMNAATCEKHEAGIGVPCWQVQIGIDKRLAPAVCGARIRRAGYTGTIRPESMLAKASKPAYPARKRANAPDSNTK